MAVREGRKLDTVLWAVLMLAGGAMIYGGVAVINTAHTCDPYNGCSSSADAWLGFPLAFIGLALLLYGYASFVKSWAPGDRTCRRSVGWWIPRTSIRSRRPVQKCRLGSSSSHCSAWPSWLSRRSHSMR